MFASTTSCVLRATRQWFKDAHHVVASVRSTSVCVLQHTHTRMTSLMFATSRQHDVNTWRRTRSPESFGERHSLRRWSTAHTNDYESERCDPAAADDARSAHRRVQGSFSTLLRTTLKGYYRIGSTRTRRRGRNASVPQDTQRRSKSADTAADDLQGSRALSEPQTHAAMASTDRANPLAPRRTVNPTLATPPCKVGLAVTTLNKHAPTPQSNTNERNNDATLANSAGPVMFSAKSPATSPSRVKTESIGSVDANPFLRADRSRGAATSANSSTSASLPRRNYVIPSQLSSVSSSLVSVRSTRARPSVAALFAPAAEVVPQNTANTPTLATPTAGHVSRNVVNAKTNTIPRVNGLFNTPSGVDHKINGSFIVPRETPSATQQVQSTSSVVSDATKTKVLDRTTSQLSRETEQSIVEATSSATSAMFDNNRAASITKRPTLRTHVPPRQLTVRIRSESAESIHEAEATFAAPVTDTIPTLNSASSYTAPRNDGSMQHNGIATSFATAGSNTQVLPLATPVSPVPATLASPIAQQADVTRNEGSLLTPVSSAEAATTTATIVATDVPPTVPAPPTFADYVRWNTSEQKQYTKEEKKDDKALEVVVGSKDAQITEEIDDKSLPELPIAELSTSTKELDVSLPTFDLAGTSLMDDLSSMFDSLGSPTSSSASFAFETSPTMASMSSSMRQPSQTSVSSVIKPFSTAETRKVQTLKLAEELDKPMPGGRRYGVVADVSPLVATRIAEEKKQQLKEKSKEMDSKIVPNVEEPIQLRASRDEGASPAKLDIKQKNPAILEKKTITTTSAASVSSPEPAQASLSVPTPSIATTTTVVPPSLPPRTRKFSPNSIVPSNSTKTIMQTPSPSPAAIAAATTTATTVSLAPSTQSAARVHRKPIPTSVVTSPTTISTASSSLNMNNKGTNSEISILGTNVIEKNTLVNVTPTLSTPTLPPRPSTNLTVNDVYNGARHTTNNNNANQRISFESRAAPLTPGDSVESIVSRGYEESNTTNGNSNNVRPSLDETLAKATAYAAALSSLISPMTSNTELNGTDSTTSLTNVPSIPPRKKNNSGDETTTMQMVTPGDSLSSLVSAPSADTFEQPQATRTTTPSPTRALKPALKVSESTASVSSAGSSSKKQSAIESPKTVRFGYAWKDEFEQRHTIDYSDERSSSVTGLDVENGFETPADVYDDRTLGYLYSQVINLEDLPFTAALGSPCTVEVRVLQGDMILDSTEVILAPSSTEMDIGLNSTLVLKRDEPLKIEFKFKDLSLAPMVYGNTLKKRSTLSKVSGMFSMRRSTTSGGISSNLDASAMSYLNNPTKPLTLTAETILRFEDSLGELIRMPPTITDSFISDHQLKFNEATVLELAGAKKSTAVMSFEGKYIPFAPKIGLTPNVLPVDWSELQNVWGIVEWNRVPVINGGLWQLGGDCAEWTYRKFSLAGSKMYYEDYVKGKPVKEANSDSQFISLRQLETVLQFNPQRHCRKFSVGLESKQKLAKSSKDLSQTQPTGVHTRKPFRSDTTMGVGNNMTTVVSSGKEVNPPILDEYGCDITAFTLVFKDGREIAFRTDENNYSVSQRWRQKIMQGEEGYDPTMEIELDAQDLAYVWISCAKDVIGKPTVPAWWEKLEKLTSS